jgi:hypothetical protein
MASVLPSSITGVDQRCPAIAVSAIENMYGPAIDGIHPSGSCEVARQSSNARSKPIPGCSCAGVEFGEGADNEMSVFHTMSVNGGFWARLLGSPAGPPARSYHAMAADPSRDKVYVFGGCPAAGKGRLNDLWELDAPTLKWTQLPTCDAIEVCCAHVSMNM